MERIMASSGGGWGTFFKQELGREGIIFTSNFFRAVLKHYTFFKKPPPPPGRNKQSFPKVKVIIKFLKIWEQRWIHLHNGPSLCKYYYAW